MNVYPADLGPEEEVSRSIHTTISYTLYYIHIMYVLNTSIHWALCILQPWA